jgi:hypothetical protein
MVIVSSLYLEALQAAGIGSEQVCLLDPAYDKSLLSEGRGWRIELLGIVFRPFSATY